MLPTLKFLYRAWRYRLKVDPAEIRYMLQALQPGDTAVDAGCHKGGYLYWMQKRTGRSGACYAFEPQPALYQYLAEMRRRFGWTHVHLAQKALSAQPGVMPLYVPVNASGVSPGATLNAVEATGVIHQVPVDTLDACLLDRGIRPAFIKIDVEGHELQVLKGGRRLLETCKPKLLIECEARHQPPGSTTGDVFRFLENLGYRGYFFHRGHLRPLGEFDPATHQKTGDGRFWAAADYVNNFVFE